MKSSVKLVETSTTLVSCHLLESAPDGSPLWTWSYPNIEGALRAICMRKCGAMMKNFSRQNDSTGEGFCRFFHVDKFWFYVYLATAEIASDDNNSGPSKIKTIGVVVVSEDFSPDKYQKVGEILHLSYKKTGNPTVVLKQFLSLIVDGVCLIPKKKTFKLADYESTAPFTQHQIKGIISRFGLETILIYTALLRKRKIVVYHYNIDELNQFIMSLPFLVASLQNSIWNSIYPWVDLNEEEIAFMKNIPFYIMGCTQAGIENRNDLFDVFINIPAAEINVPLHAKERISMNKTHKEMAMFMVQSASSDSTEEQVVDEIAKQSQTIMDKLLMTKNTS